jgi:hypothetical protein
VQAGGFEARGAISYQLSVISYPMDWKGNGWEQSAEGSLAYLMADS